MSFYLQFVREERAGMYKEYKYPNLVEMQKQGHFSIGYLANVTEELVLAAFRGEERLTVNEILKVAYHSGIPYSVLTCPRLILLDMGRRRHRKMIAEVDGSCIQLRCMAGNGNQEAERGVWSGQTGRIRFS